MTDATEQRIALPDGRTLTYREYGDPAGAPLVNCHGGLICGLDIGPADAAARNLGVRIVSPDRPGVGSSTPKPGRTTGDWADDVSALAHHLSIDRFAVIGWSMGGQYAAAVAARLADRVTALALVAGAPPLDDPTRFGELNRMDRAMTRISQRSHVAGRAMFGTLGRLARKSPDRFTRTSTRDLPEPDRAALEALGPGVFADWAAHAMSDPAGMVEEYRAWVRPWGCTLDQITCPTDVWQGTDDTLVPPPWGAVLHEAILHSTLHAVAGAGHLVAFERWPEVLRPLARSTGS